MTSLNRFADPVYCIAIDCRAGLCMSWRSKTSRFPGSGTRQRPGSFPCCRDRRARGRTLGRVRFAYAPGRFHFEWRNGGRIFHGPRRGQGRRSSGNSNGAIFPDPEQRRTSYRSVLDISVHRLLRRRPLEHRCIAVPQERSRDAAIDCLTRAKIDVILSDRMNSLNPYTPTRCVT